MGINKVVYGNDTLIDISEDTVTPGSVLSGVSFHSADGAEQIGSLIARKVTDTVKDDFDSLVNQSDEGDLIIVTDEEAEEPIPLPYVDYSLEEKVIGAFTDGRPLYRKCYEGDVNWTSSATTNNVIDSGFGSTKTLVNAQGFMTQTAGNTVLIGSIINSGSNGSVCWAISNNLAIRQFTGGNISHYFVAVEYIKKSDAPNSFSPDMIWR